MSNKMLLMEAADNRRNRLLANSNMSNSIRADIRPKTSDEKIKRALAVETMYRLYKKYYPIWVKQQK